MAQGEARFTPIDRSALWRELALNVNQVAELVGCSRRMIAHWVEEGYIAPNPGPEGGPQRFNGEAIERAILIFKGRAAGLSLKAAAEAAQAFLGHAHWSGAQHLPEPAELSALYVDVEQARHTLERAANVLRVLSGNEIGARGQPTDGPA